MRRRTFLAAVGVGAFGASGVAAQEDGRQAAGEPYEPLGHRQLRGAREAVVGPDGTTAYVAVTDGIATVDVQDPTDPQVLAERRDVLADHERGPLDVVGDVAIDGDRLLAVGPPNDPRDLAAAVLYDVRDPADPTRIAHYETDFAIHNGYLDDSYAYLTENNGSTHHLVIVDVTGPTVVSRWSIVDQDDAWADVPAPLRSVHDVWVGSDVAVLAYWDVGTVLLDVADPTDPTFLGRVGERSPETLAAAPAADRTGLPGNDHYACLDESGTLLAIGKEAWETSRFAGPGGIHLWDVSDPSNPTQLSRIAPPPTPDPSIPGVWTTAHNFDLAGDRLYSSWYRGGVKIHDVSDPSHPRELAWWREPRQASFWTAVHASGCVVASDRGVRGEGGSIYTFPDRAGTQPDPESLTPYPTQSSTGTPTEMSTAPTERMSPSPATTQSETAITTPSTQPSDAPTEAETTATGGQPGFGVPTMVAALGLGELYRRRRT